MGLVFRFLLFGADPFCHWGIIYGEREKRDQATWSMVDNRRNYRPNRFIADVLLDFLNKHRLTSFQSH